MLDPDLPRTKADTGQVEQLRLNLSLNARDAMPGDGTLTKRQASWERMAKHRSGFRYATPAVASTMRRARESSSSFFTTKEQGKGTGLGLSTVYGIVQQVRGTIEAETAPGAGTLFTISMPATNEDLPGVQELPIQASPRGVESIRSWRTRTSSVRSSHERLQRIGRLGDRIALLRQRTVALPWFVLVTTGSAARMGIVLAVEMAPVALLGILSGSVVARLGARRTMQLSDLARVPLMCSIRLLHSAGMLSFPLLLAIVFAIGCFLAPFFASQRVILPELVGEDETTVAQAC